MLIYIGARQPGANTRYWVMAMHMSAAELAASPVLQRRWRRFLAPAGTTMKIPLPQGSTLQIRPTEALAGEITLSAGDDIAALHQALVNVAPLWSPIELSGTDYQHFRATGRAMTALEAVLIGQLTDQDGERFGKSIIPIVHRQLPLTAIDALLQQPAAHLNTWAMTLAVKEGRLDVFHRLASHYGPAALPSFIQSAGMSDKLFRLAIAQRDLPVFRALLAHQHASLLNSRLMLADLFGDTAFPEFLRAAMQAGAISQKHAAEHVSAMPVAHEGLPSNFHVMMKTFRQAGLLDVETLRSALNQAIANNSPAAIDVLHHDCQHIDINTLAIAQPKLGLLSMPPREQAERRAAGAGYYIKRFGKRPASWPPPAELLVMDRGRYPYAQLQFIACLRAGLYDDKDLIGLPHHRIPLALIIKHHPEPARLLPLLSGQDAKMAMDAMMGESAGRDP